MSSDNIYIAKGPYGLCIIEVYDPGEGELCVSHVDGFDGKRALLTVEDAKGVRVADAVVDLDNPEIEEAKQWLLDFTRCSL
jgi:hypothetical protein